MLDVLIADDSIPISIHLSNAITSSNVRCVGILNDGTKVYQKMKELNPDVLILDLKMPGKNGIDILREIQVDKSIHTKIFIYSGESEYMTLASQYDCIERFFSKYIPAEEIAKELERLEDSITNRSKENKVADILFKIGFTYTLKGTRLINDCILYSIEKDEDNIKNIYYELAKRKGENVNTIKSDINTAINSMWRYTDKSKVRRILRIGEYEKPSTKTVVSMVKYYINN